MGSEDGQYYVFFNSLGEWSVGTTDHFEANALSQNGRRFALIVDSVSCRDILSPELLQGWLEWDVLLGEWVSPPGVGVSAAGWTKPTETVELTIKVGAGKPHKLQVPYAGRLDLITTELKRRNLVNSTGKLVK